MRHLMRAEYEDPEPGRKGGEHGPVKTWHMARRDEAVAMCGRALVPGSEALSDEEWGRTAEPVCHTCGALYLREVP